ncbi:CD1375 family protein [Parablautia intestinalis]|nr:CD1375 family protein [Parablautia intestinalis]
MGRFYGIQIKNGDMNFEQVPKLWKKSTEKWLAENQ